MDIRKVSVEQLKPSAYNPRKDLKPGDIAWEELRKSILTYGYVDPLVWNERTGNLVGGHQRLKVLASLGYTEVEVSVVDLPLQKEKELNVALNKIQGEWDDLKLAELLNEFLAVPELDFGALGFQQEEISSILDKFTDAKKEDSFDFQAAVDAITEPVTKRGDLIILGSHRILCGSSDSEADVKKLFGEEKAAMVHTDPPYGCSYLAQNRPDLESRPKKSKKWEKLYKDDLNEEEYEKWIESVLKNMAAYLQDGASAYVWNGHAKFYFMHHMMKKLGFHISTVITWAKPNFAISYGDYNQQTEFCLYGWLKSGSHSWYGPTSESNLWEVAREKTENLIHPTQKSVDLPARAIRNSSQRGDLIMDLFLGSGSTLIAAESVDRRCYGMEIEPKYCDAIVKRYIAYVGPENVSSELVERYGAIAG
jgi:DNA modification methylase